jgi:hypothetical protein
MDDNLSRRKFMEQLGLGTAAGLGLSLWRPSANCGNHDGPTRIPHFFWA